MGSHTSLYSPLNPAKSEIRLLEIGRSEDGKDPNPTGYRLHTVSLDENPAFYALSYIWGDPRITADILISRADEDVYGEFTAGHKLAVTKNLDSALRILDIGPVFLWVDAICINQADLEERASQVQIMGRIYNSAKFVLAWLGDGREISLGLSSLKTLAAEIVNCRREGSEDFFTFDWLKCHRTLLPWSWQPESPAWEAMNKILMHPYWSRMWIFQEAVLAKQLIITGGRQYILYEDAGIVSARFRGFAAKNVQKPDWIPLDFWQQSVMKLGLSNPQCLEMVRKAKIRVKAPERDLESEWHIWDSAMLAGQSLTASDPKDHVYAVLGVCNVSMVPDYTDAKSLSDVYREFTEIWLNAHRKKPRPAESETLDPLSFLALSGIGINGQVDGFSSWALNYPHTCDFSSISTLFGKADCGIPGFEHDPYPVVQNKSLFVTGVQIDRLVSTMDMQGLEAQEVSPRLVSIMAEFMSRHPRYVTGLAPLEPFVQLIGRGNGQWETGRTEVLYSLALLSVLIPDAGTEPSARDRLPLPSSPSTSDADPAGHLEDWFRQRFLNERNFDLESLGFEEGILPLLSSDTLEGPLGTPYLQICSMLQTIHKSNWKLFETAEGYLGLAHQGAKPGDLVYVLNRCGVPVVLRKEGEHMLHVGTTTVIGLMEEGEAPGIVRKGGIVPEKIELR